MASRKYLHFTTLLQTHSNISFVSLVALLSCVYGLLYGRIKYLPNAYKRASKIKSIELFTIHK